jgi:hypothetical protein
MVMAIIVIDGIEIMWALLLCYVFFFFASLEHIKFGKEELQTLFVELGDACFGWFFTFALLHTGRGIFFVELCYGFALILLQDLVHAYLV